MKCARCKGELTEYQWQTKSDKGPRHLTCPQKGGYSARRRQRQVLRYLQEARSRKKG